MESEWRRGEKGGLIEARNRWRWEHCLCRQDWEQKYCWHVIVFGQSTVPALSSFLTPVIVRRSKMDANARNNALASHVILVSQYNQNDAICVVR